MTDHTYFVLNTWINVLGAIYFGLAFAVAPVLAICGAGTTAIVIVTLVYLGICIAFGLRQVGRIARR